MSASRVAVVTGANKGIGYAVVKGLSQHYKGHVYLTSRDTARGQAAVDKLAQEGLTVRYHQLDITDPSSVSTFCSHIKKEHDGLDVLINNAGIAFGHHSTEPFGKQAEITLRTNYFATRDFCQQAFPLLKPGARVVNVTSMLGHLSVLNGTGAEALQIKQQLADPAVSQATVDRLADDFLQKAKNGTHIEGGWIGNSYAVSKVLLSVLTRIQQREIDQQRPNDSIVINCVHPGYVDTDMTSHKGPFTPDRGAQPILYCSQLPAGETTPRGQFIWHDNHVVEFTAPSYPSS